jgi:hypothetical protein
MLLCCVFKNKLKKTQQLVMKNTFKFSALVVAFAGLALGAKAQTTPSSTGSSNGVRFSIGVDAGLPVSNLSNSYNWSLGGSVQADIPVISQLAVTINAGYNNFYGKDVAGTNLSAPNLQLLPVNHFYIQGEAGAAFALNKTDVNFNNATAFIYAPQIGYQFPIGKSIIDAGVRYEGSTQFISNNDNSKVNFVALRLAYGF